MPGSAVVEPLPVVPPELVEAALKAAEDRWQTGDRIQALVDAIEQTYVDEYRQRREQR